MRINKGDTLEEITLPKADGTMFSLSETKGKKVLLTFYRVAGCTFCNLRLMEFNKRFNELGKNFVHVGIFHSPVDLLNLNMSKHRATPFIVLADKDFKYFEKYEIERSWTKLMIAVIYKTFSIFPALLKGFIPFLPVLVVILILLLLMY
ncbi:redoxin domain-containing protein [Alphaproteobacteria bacterium]|nr:redoxin domain-containing protein [Alphaproteobacteria bacterium]